jgi:hypothetical protein
MIPLLQGFCEMSSVTSETTAPKRTSPITFCSDFTEASGADPAGTAWANRHYIMMEIPLPWPYAVYSSKRVPPGLQEYLESLYAREIWIAGVAIAPDENYSVPGMTRVIDLQMPESPLTRYQRNEYLVPTARTTDAVRAIIEGDGERILPAWKQEIDSSVRDFFICTHGAIDACCATYGYPTYKLLRSMAERSPVPMRVWRCSHFGGHSWASTMLEMPDGRYWGHLKPQDLAPLVLRNTPFAELRAHYRGWAAIPAGESQVAEAAALEHLGWDWLDCEIAADHLPERVYGDPPHDATVTFHYRHPGTGESGEITVDVIANGTTAIMQASGVNPETYEQPQWRTAIR